MTPVQVLIVTLFVLASVSMVVTAVVAVLVFLKVNEYVRLAGQVLQVSAAIGDETRRKVATAERAAVQAAAELPAAVKQAVAEAVPTLPGGRRAYDPPLGPVEESER